MTERRTDGKLPGFGKHLGSAELMAEVRIKPAAFRAVSCRKATSAAYLRRDRFESSRKISR